MQHSKMISFVVPAFNEAHNIKKLYDELLQVMTSSNYGYELIFVDDGSADDTLEVIKSLVAKNQSVYFVELSRNFGHQAALKAGIDIAKGDCVITMDSDLQHPPAIVTDLIRRWEEGYDVVYTRRKEDRKLPWFKRKTSSLYYQLYNSLSEIKLDKGTADFRLMSRNVVDAFSHLRENELFIRGLIKWAGFKQTAVEYEPNERFAGVTKYNLKQMMSFAVKGITAFSVKPLKIVAYVGLTFFLISMIFLPYALLSYMLGETVPGWTSTIMAIVFFGSLQLLMLGIIGLYLSKLFIQSKQRPLYFIRKTNYKAKDPNTFPDFK